MHIWTEMARVMFLVLHLYLLCCFTGMEVRELRGYLTRNIPGKGKAKVSGVKNISNVLHSKAIAPENVVHHYFPSFRYKTWAK